MVDSVKCRTQIKSNYSSDFLVFHDFKNIINKSKKGRLAWVELAICRMISWKEIVFAYMLIQSVEYGFFNFDKKFKLLYKRTATLPATSDQLNTS
jgi:hypothetical protein